MFMLMSADFAVIPITYRASVCLRQPNLAGRMDMVDRPVCLASIRWINPVCCSPL